MSVGDLPGVVQGDGGGRTVEAQLSPAGEWRMAVYSGECSQYIYTVSIQYLHRVSTQWRALICPHYARARERSRHTPPPALVTINSF